MNKYSILLILLLSCLSFSGFAQKERKFIRKGNDQFDEKQYESSEVLYRKALEKKNNSFSAGFNLGDALYKQKKYDEALKQFQGLAATEKNPENLGKLYHNIGNTLLMNNKVDESIEAYKESLRQHPNSKETKYNLEYARHLKKQQEEQQKKQQQQNQQNQDNKDQNKQEQKGKEDQKKQDQKDQEKQNQEQKDQQDQKKQQQGQNEKKDAQPMQEQEGKISKEDAQRLLEALQNDEKKVQEKVQKAKAKQKKAKKAKIKKDW